MIDYNWNCKTVDAYVEKAGNSDVVYNVHWKLTGSEFVPNSEGNDPPTGKTYSITNIGLQVLDTSEITNFIPWNEVTEVEVEAWTKAAMGEEQVLLVETNIAAQIALSIAPVSVQLVVGQPI
jgi:hypothetical protein|tara:strand:- start:28 stop:393 length:366 start_codon:yes stop_codon:yes gene_type:complete